MTPEHRTEDDKAGQTVAGIVQPTSTPTTIPPVELRGTVLRYDAPTAPVADSEWEVLQ